MPSILVFFRKEDCNSCSTRSLCTRAKSGPQGLKLRPGAQHEALRAARNKTSSSTSCGLEWRALYHRGCARSACGRLAIVDWLG